MNDDTRKNEPKKMTKNLKKPLMITSLLAFLFCVTTVNLNQGNNQLSNENSQLKKQVSELIAENETFHPTTTSQDIIEDYSSQIEKLKASNTELSEKVKSLEKNTEKAQNQQSTINKLNKKISSQKSKIVRLNAKISSLKSKNVSLKEKVSTLNSQIAQYKNSATKSNRTSSSSESSYTVYITATGSKYHRNGCRYLSRSQISISKSDAISQGYDACSVCNP